MELAIRGALFFGFLDGCQYFVVIGTHGKDGPRETDERIAKPSYTQHHTAPHRHTIHDYPHPCKQLKYYTKNTFQNTTKINFCMIS
jgi:hypothetical protein